jgi:hypothetical protein
MLPFAFGSSEMLIVVAFRRGRAGEANITLTLSARLCHLEKHSAFGDYPDLRLRTSLAQAQTERSEMAFAKGSAAAVY